MSQTERKSKPLLEKGLETVTAIGVFGIIIGVAAQAYSILHASIGLTVAGYAGKKVAYP